mmetsp:Transcript_64792/g.204590  ORF Transcript_64792/g.204590 Transcript_64792/m.204590 type:complete len:317 (-) Transcript_64792:739-1689(-)
MNAPHARGLLLALAALLAGAAAPNGAQPPGLAEKSFEAGKQAYFAGDAGLAINHFRTALQLDPAHSKAANNLGVIYESLKDFPQALQAYMHAYALNQTNVPVMNNIGNVLRLEGRLGEGGEWYRRALKVDPGHGTTWYNLGIALTFDGKGQQREALAAFLRCIKCGGKSVAGALEGAGAVLSTYTVPLKDVAEEVGVPALPPAPLASWESPLEPAISYLRAAQLEQIAAIPRPPHACRPALVLDWGDHPDVAVEVLEVGSRGQEYGWPAPRVPRGASLAGYAFAPGSEQGGPASAFNTTLYKEQALYVATFRNVGK